jgi:hypothetical protein
MRCLATILLVVCALKPGWGYLLEYPWVFLTLPLYILFTEILDD